MKKLLAGAVMGMSLLFASPFTTQAAQENIDFDELIYPTQTTDQYASLAFWDYIFGVNDNVLKDTSFTHMKLTNGKYYDFWDYIFSLTEKGDFDAAMKDVAANKQALSLSVVAGKIDANGKVIADSNAVVREFKVVEIK